jgi:hypothetical protein
MRFERGNAQKGLDRPRNRGHAPERPPGHAAPARLPLREVGPSGATRCLRRRRVGVHVERALGPSGHGARGQRLAGSTRCQASTAHLVLCAGARARVHHGKGSVGQCHWGREPPPNRETPPAGHVFRTRRSDRSCVVAGGVGRPSTSSGSALRLRRPGSRLAAGVGPPFSHSRVDRSR